MKKNVLTQGKKAKADEAARAGRLDEAHALFKSVCRTDAADVEAWVKLGLVEKRLGRLQESEACARRALAISPRLGFCHYALGVALHSQCRVLEAIAAYRKAIELQPDFADTYYLLGSAMHETGALAEAISWYRKSLALRPDFPEALGELGAILIGMGEVEQGAALLSRALALQPGNAIVLSNMSSALRLQGKVTEALEGYRHALRLAPDSVDVIAGLADLLEKTDGGLVEAGELVERGLKMAPLDPATNLVAAQLARREKRFQDAAELLEKLRSQPLRPEVVGDIELALGQIYDQLDDSERAFPLIVSGNEKKAKLSLLRETGREMYLERVARISSLATSALARCVEPQAGCVQSDHHDPVFLIGFPRSGTTLLEQILDSHPAIQAMEEKGAVAAMVNAFLADAGDGVEALAELSDEGVSRLRQIYFDEVKRYVDISPGALLVNKLPLNTVAVPVIWRVFPNARFVLAIRHPCDASLSCLMQNFAANDGMASFFSLEDTVHTYAAVMGAWRKYADLLPLAYHRIRYEDLVANVEGESRRLLTFLGVGWDDAVLKHTEHARKRGAINTPSYHQVVQPIYQHARYRWKRYENQFVSVMPILQPFISYFGYAEP